MGSVTLSVKDILRATIRDFTVLFPQALRWAIVAIVVLGVFVFTALYRLDGPDFFAVRVLHLAYSEILVETFPFVSVSKGSNSAVYGLWELYDSRLLKCAVVFLLLSYSGTPLLYFVLHKVLPAANNVQGGYFGVWRQRSFWRLVGYDILIMLLVMFVIFLAGLVFLVLCIPLLFLAFFVIGAGAGYGGDAWQTPISLLGWYLFNLLDLYLLCVPMLVQGKLLLVYPLVILGERSPLKASWRMTKGCLLRVAGLALLTLYLTCLLQYLLIALALLVWDTWLLLPAAAGVWSAILALASWKGILSAKVYLALRE